MHGMTSHDPIKVCHVDYEAAIAISILFADSAITDRLR